MLIRILIAASIALFVAAMSLHSQPALVTSVLLGGAAAVLAMAAPRLAPKDLQDRLRAQADPHLQPGEIVQVGFEAVGGPGPYLSLIACGLAVLISLAIGSRYGSFVVMSLLFVTTRWSIVATDRAILLLSSSPARREILTARLPRYTRLGPVSGWWGMICPNGKWLFVHRQFHANVEWADKLIARHQILEGSSPRSDHSGGGRTNVSLRSRNRGRGP